MCETLRQRVTTFTNTDGDQKLLLNVLYFQFNSVASVPQMVSRVSFIT